MQKAIAATGWKEYEANGRKSVLLYLLHTIYADYAMNRYFVHSDTKETTWDVPAAVTGSYAQHCCNGADTAVI